jgi:HSP20 family protein
MLMRFDPFRELDRAVDQLSQRAGPATIPFDAVRRADEVVVYFDIPGVEPDAIDLTVERNVLTLRAERRYEPAEDEEILAVERRQGVFARQLYLGEALDTTGVRAKYDHGVLTVSVPLAKQAQPRKVTIGQAQRQAETIQAESTETSAEQGHA